MTQVTIRTETGPLLAAESRRGLRHLLSRVARPVADMIDRFSLDAMCSDVPLDGCQSPITWRAPILSDPRPGRADPG